MNGFTTLLIAAGICFVFVALLAVPLSLEYRVSRRQTMQRNLRLRWLFGLVSIELTRPDRQGRREATASRIATDRESGRRSRVRGRVLSALRYDPFRRRLLRFVREAWRTIEARDVRLHARIGLGDPADTGQLWALLGPAAGFLASRPDTEIVVEPEFIDPVFEFDSSGEVRLVPLRFLYLAAGLLLSPATWRGFRLMRGAV